jgi:replicative DNA helicase
MNYEVELLNAVLVSDEESTQDILALPIEEWMFNHSTEWKFINDHYNKYGKFPDKKTVKDQFKNFDVIKVTEPFEYYVDKARKESLNQGMRQLTYDTVEMLKEGSPDAALAHVLREAQKFQRDSIRVKDTDIAGEYMERVEDFRERVANEEDTLGIPSGISTIDQHFGGWQEGDLVCLMGWTGVGKSFFAILFAINAWLQGYKPLFVSLEMSKKQMEYRVDTILNEGKHFTNSQLVHARGVNPDEYEDWARGMFADKQPFQLVTSDGIEQPDVNMVQSKIDQYDPDLVILDYHSLFEDSSGAHGETEKVKNLSKAFKRLAVRNAVPVIDIVAVTMQQGDQERRAPELAEVAWSKQLAYDSDLVMAIHRPNETSFEIQARKVRRGQKFMFYLDWDLDTGVWSESYDALGMWDGDDDDG